MINIQNYNINNKNFNYNKKVGFQATLSKSVKKDLLSKYGLSPESISDYITKFKKNPKDFIIENIDTYGGKHFNVRINENSKITLIMTQFKHIKDVLEYMISY